METTDGRTSEPLGRALAIARGIVQRAIWMFDDVGAFSPPDLSDLSDVYKRGASLYEQILQGVSPLSGSRDEAWRGDPEEMTKALVGAVFPAVRKVEDLVRTARDAAGFPVHFAERAGGGGPGDALWMDLSGLEDAINAHGIPPEESPSTVLGRILDTLAQIEARLATPQPFPSPKEPVAVDDRRSVPQNPRSWQVTEFEYSILGALDGKSLTQGQIARKLKRDTDGHLKSTLSSLVKRGILKSKQPGYVIAIERWRERVTSA